MSVNHVVPVLGAPKTAIVSFRSNFLLNERASMEVRARGSNWLFGKHLYNIELRR